MNTQICKRVEISKGLVCSKSDDDDLINFLGKKK